MAAALEEHDQLIGSLDRELAQQNLIDQREDSRVGADSKRERQNGNRGEKRAPAQPAKCIAQIGPGSAHIESLDG